MKPDERDPPDAALIAAVADGDEQAFTTLVRRYQGRFHRVARRMLGDDREAEDAVQTALLQVFRHASGYRDRWKGSTWLYRILTNVCIDAWRKRRPVSAEDVDDGTPAQASPEGDRIDVDRALARLPPEARAILLLCYVEELSYADAALARGVTINTVKTQLARAKRLMRRELGEVTR